MTGPAYRQDWLTLAACAIGSSRDFHKPQSDTAKAVCQRCPVRPECLLDALTTQAPHGVWGGLSSEERKALPALPTDKTQAVTVLRGLLDLDTVTAPEEPLALGPRPRNTGGHYTPEERAEYERRTVELLRGRATYAEIREQVDITAPVIVRIRRQAGLPTSGRPGGDPARTRAEALAVHVEPYGDGHAHWTGPMSGRMPQLHAESDRFNARHVLFEQHHGRPPVGYVRSGCGEQACITGAHLTDNVLRDAQHTAVARHSTALSEGTSPAVTTTPSAPPLPTKDLIKWAEEHADSSVQALAARVRESLADLRLRYEAAHELIAIASKKEELEAQLAALTAREAELAPRKRRKAGAYVRDYDTRTVRAWAAENGVDCPGTGQIPKHVLDAWRAAVTSPTAGTP